jgi:TonB family protein
MQVSLRSFLYASTFLLATLACGQSSQPAPSDPAEFLKLAAQKNGLGGADLRPWHIKVTYQTYDDHGKPAEQGVFEDWWAAPKQYKMTFSRNSFHRTTYVSKSGNTDIGDRDLPFPEYLLTRVLISPIEEDMYREDSKLRSFTKRFGKVDLHCIQEIPAGLKADHPPAEDPVFPTVCFEPSAPMLRISGSFGEGSLVIEKVAALDERYLPEDATVYDNGMPVLSFHLDQGESTASWDPSIFQPPASASANNAAGSDTVTLNAAVVSGTKIAGQPPSYPLPDKIQRVQGTVVLKALIGTDGRIRRLRVVSAPDDQLAISAMTAVKTWRYRPYLLAGLPVNVETQLNIVYHLSY